MTPINAAMLLNHEGCVKKFLGYPEVDVNCVDEGGRTLLTLALLDLSERTLEFAKYLLQRGADPNKADVDAVFASGGECSPRLSTRELAGFHTCAHPVQV